MIRTPLMNVMTAAVLKAGRGLKRDFGEVASITIQRKGPGDFVSEADRAAEKILFTELSKARPGYGFRMEEGGSVEGSDASHVWHIDPLDGTTNFLRGIPFFAVSVGLERDGQIVAGVVYNPISEEMFMAEKGQGAFVTGATTRDNYRLRVSPRVDPYDTLVCCGIPNLGRGDAQAFVRVLEPLMSKVGGVRRLGSAALELAYVGAGRFDAFFQRGLSSWDMAAGLAIVREAGGFASDYQGGETMLASGDIVAGSEFAHREMLALLRAAARSPK